MKRYGLIGIILLAALAACTPSPKVPEPVEGPTPELSAIDSLMWQHPDSALQCLLACRDVSGNVSTTRFDDHYANLLLAELLYKTFIPI